MKPCVLAEVRGDERRARLRCIRTERRTALGADGHRRAIPSSQGPRRHRRTRHRRTRPRYSAVVDPAGPLNIRPPRRPGAFDARYAHRGARLGSRLKPQVQSKRGADVGVQVDFGKTSPQCPVESVDVNGWERTRNVQDTGPIASTARADGRTVTVTMALAVPAAASKPEKQLCRNPVSGHQVGVEVIGSGSSTAGAGAGKVPVAPVGLGGLYAVRAVRHGDTITLTFDVGTVGTEEGSPTSSAPTVGRSQITNQSNTTL